LGPAHHAGPTPGSDDTGLTPKPDALETRGLSTPTDRPEQAPGRLVCGG